MGLIKEPLDVDFSIGHRRVTQKELNEISEFIRKDKLKNTPPEPAVKRQIPTFRPISQRKKELV
jgi:hypothetical protein